MLCYVYNIDFSPFGKVCQVKEGLMDLLTVENLLTYWRMFGTSELKMPKGAETLVEDTIKALEEYKEILQKRQEGEG